MENNPNPQLEKFNEEINAIQNNMFKDNPDSYESEAIVTQSLKSDEDPQEIVIAEDNVPEEGVSFHPEEQEQPEVDPVYEAHIQEKKRLAKLKREKFQIAEQKRQIEQEALRLQQENEYLRNQQMTSSNAALYHNENSINMQKASVRESLKKAFDMSDGELVADLTAELARLENEAQRINTYKMQEAYAAQQYQQQYQQQYIQPQYNEPHQVELPAATLEWAERNPWIIPNSADYDEDKINELAAYSNYLDNYLERNGRHDEFQTPQYFQAIDNHMKKVFGEQPSYNSSQRKQNLSMNKSQVPVAPVRRSGSGGYGNSSSNQVSLTAGQKDMAKRIEQATKGMVKPSHYAAAALDSQKKTQDAIKNGDLQYLRHHGLMSN